MPAQSSSIFPRKGLFLVLTLLYAAAAVFSAIAIIAHADASTHTIEKILKLHGLKNEGAQALEKFDQKNPILGTFIDAPVKNNLELPSADQAAEALHSEVPHLLKEVRREAAAAAWISCGFLSLSLLYVVIVVALERSFTNRPVLFALTCVSLVCFVIGVLAPAMIIWTAPTIPIASGNLQFVLQHEIRGIAAIIQQLFTSGHWVIGGFLLLFSILTPLTKAALTFFITVSGSKTLNYRIGEILHTIGKWSMADVFVAGILLAIYALKSQEATKSLPCIGLYYFLGYCILSLTTTELLVHSEATDPDRAAGRPLSNGILAGLFAVFLCCLLGAGLYTNGEYPLDGKGKDSPTSLPQQLKEENLTPPPVK